MENNKELIYPELSYKLIGIAFNVYNHLELRNTLFKTKIRG